MKGELERSVSDEAIRAETEDHCTRLASLTPEQLRDGYREVYRLNLLLRRQLVELAAIARPMYVAALTYDVSPGVCIPSTPAPQPRF